MADEVTDDGRYVFLVMLQVQPVWLGLDRSTRDTKAGAVRATRIYEATRRSGRTE